MSAETMAAAMLRMEEEVALRVLEFQLERTVELKARLEDNMKFQRRVIWFSRFAAFCALVSGVLCFRDVDGSTTKAFVNGALLMVNLWAFGHYIMQERRWHEVLEMQRDLPTLEKTIHELAAKIKEGKCNGSH